MDVEAVWLAPEGQQWEVVVRLRGGDKVRYRCATRAEARERALSLMHSAREIADTVRAWQAPVRGYLSTRLAVA